ncbi:MAG: DUF4878 domain-containing protein [Bacteroidales bacterium]|nr:DUF4878 domain-containing protein [Bacteroidales bacterium]
MKKIRIFCLALLAAFVLSSCHTEDKTTPEYATETFVDAFYTADFNTMYKCTPKNYHPIIEQMQRAMNKNKTKFEQIKENEVEILETTCVSQNDSVAQCECHFKYNGMERKVTYVLCKEDGKWLVDLTI